MDVAEALKYGKIAYEFHAENILDFGDWDNLDIVKKRYWTTIAITVLSAYQKWSERNFGERNLSDH